MFHAEAATSDKNRDGAILHFSGEMTLTYAGEVRTALLQALDCHQQVWVSLEGVTTLDITALQLLCAAHRYAVRKKRTFTFVFPPGRNILDTVLTAGYSRDGICISETEGCCIWNN